MPVLKRIAVKVRSTVSGATIKRPGSAAILAAKSQAGRTPVVPSKSLHMQWHSRGYLPHLDSPGLIQFVTFRLYDSLPAEVILRWEEELDLRDGASADDPRAAELRKRISRHEDAGHGTCFLNDDRIASVV
jgi:hypothetical protein